MSKSNKRITLLNAILADMNESQFPGGRIKVFSIGFYKKDGEYVFFEKAIKTGVIQNQKLHDFKGIQQVDNKLRPIGHPYPVWIHAIAKYKSDKLNVYEL